MLQSLFTKVAGLEYCEIFKNSFFMGHFRCLLLISTISSKIKNKQHTKHLDNIQWMKTTIQYTLCFVKNRLRNSLGDGRFIVDISYFTLGRICFCQLIGITVESDLAPFMANLVLHYYESKRFLQTKTRPCVFRYI